MTSHLEVRIFRYPDREAAKSFNSAAWNGKPVFDKRGKGTVIGTTEDARLVDLFVVVDVVPSVGVNYIWEDDER